MRDRERGRDIGRGRSRLPTRSLMCDSIPGTLGSRPGPKAGTKGRSQTAEPHRDPLFIYFRDRMRENMSGRGRWRGRDNLKPQSRAPSHHHGIRT